MKTKKIIAMLLSLAVTLSFLSFPSFADDVEEDVLQPGSVISSEHGIDVIYVSCVENTPAAASRSVETSRSFTFSYKVKSSVTNTDIAMFYVTLTSKSDNREWYYADDGVYSYDFSTGPAYLIYWECTYKSGSYLQSAFKYNWRGSDYGPSAHMYKLNFTSGLITEQ